MNGRRTGRLMSAQANPVSMVFMTIKSKVKSQTLEQRLV